MGLSIVMRKQDRILVTGHGVQDIKCPAILKIPSRANESGYRIV